MPEKAADQFHFADQVVRRTRALRHPLCAGLDPFLDRIPRLFHSGSMRPNDPMTAAAVQRFLIAFLDRAAGKVVAQCTWAQSRRRAAVADALPDLERLLSGWDSEWREST